MFLPLTAHISCVDKQCFYSAHSCEVRASQLWSCCFTVVKHVFHSRGQTKIMNIKIKEIGC